MKKKVLFFLGLFATVMTANAQVPKISYSSANLYLGVGSAISSFDPTNTGGAIPTTATTMVSTLAGSGAPGSIDATGSAAYFGNIRDVAVDKNYYVYAADRNNNKIRKVSPSGVVTTLAGKNGYVGFSDGDSSVASFYSPQGVAVDDSGVVYIADTEGTKIRKITKKEPSFNIVSTLAGSNTQGSADGQGSDASFHSPSGIAVDKMRNTYVTDNNTIRKISKDGVVTTLAGNSNSPGSADGKGSAAQFNDASGIDVDTSGVLYVADYGNNKIRKITPSGEVSTFAGTGAAGSKDGSALSATFNHPSGIAVDSFGNVYVAEYGNNKIRKITSSGIVTTLAGSGIGGRADGVASSATFNGPLALTVDDLGSIYVVDNNKVRKITTTGYSITPVLPEGLVFNTATGGISGTPKAVSSAKTYTIMGTNASGCSYTKLNITVFKGNTKINWNMPPDITYGTPLSKKELNAFTDVKGTLVFTPSLGTILDAGTQTLTVNFTPDDPKNYTSASKILYLTVRKANPVITWDNPADITEGSALSYIQYNAKANVPGNFTYTPSSSSVLKAGDHQALAVKFTPTDSKNYRSAYDTVYINVKSKVMTNVDNENATACTIYPNPVTDGFYVQGISSQATVSIVDMTGKIALKQDVVGKTYVHCKNLLAGTYVAIIQSADKIEKIKIIKK